MKNRISRKNCKENDIQGSNERLLEYILMYIYIYI
jgi:hypothetical protein